MADSPSSVASLRNRLELGHIRMGPTAAQPVIHRRPSAPQESPLGSPSEFSSADLPGNLPAILPDTISTSTTTPRLRDPQRKPPPPPPPSAPPRKPSAPRSPVEAPVEAPVLPARFQSPVVSSASKLEERNLERMDDDHQPPSSPPPYAPPLPFRQNSIPSQPRQQQQAAPPLPPRLPPRPAPKPKAESYAYSLLKKKPAPPKPGQARNLPPPVIPPPVQANSWGQQQQRRDEPTATRRTSIGPSRPIQPPPRPEGSSTTPSPIVLPPPPPPLPPSARPSLPPRKSLPSLRPPIPTSLAVPALPKRTPSQPPPEPVQQRPEEQPPLPRRNILSMGFGGKQGKLPSPPRTPQPETRPPPVPIGSRPAVSAPILNTVSKPASNVGPPPQSSLPVAAGSGTSMSSNYQNSNAASCLKCRDFSHVDAHAAKFPRHAYDDVQRLTHDLTRNFSSDTDKARVIFTWLHHNVRYDVDAFFNNTVQPSTPASTLRTGLAVCEGFAGLFAAMAMYCGLEAVVVGGHGKGFGWSGPNSGSMPASPGGHAWNAVRIDDGVWKTIDPCWGAGYLNGGQYKQVFSPHHFTNTNEEFRRTHYPANPNQQYCEQPITWREYYLMEEGPQLYATISEPEYNYGRYTLEPGVKVLQPHTRYRFRITGSCEHTGATNDWVLMVNNGQDEETMMPDGRGGFIADTTTGASGSKIDLRVLTQFNKRSAKGVTIDQWKSKRGANSWSYAGLAAWEVK